MPLLLGQSLPRYFTLQSLPRYFSQNCIPCIYIQQNERQCHFSLGNRCYFSLGNRQCYFSSAVYRYRALKESATSPWAIAGTVARSTSEGLLPLCPSLSPTNVISHLSDVISPSYLISRLSDIISCCSLSSSLPLPLPLSLSLSLSLSHSLPLPSAPALLSVQPLLPPPDSLPLSVTGPRGSRAPAGACGRSGGAGSGPSRRARTGRSRRARGRRGTWAGGMRCGVTCGGTGG